MRVYRQSVVGFSLGQLLVFFYSRASVVCGRTERRRPPGSKRYETKVIMVWGSFLIAAAALETTTKNGYNAQGVDLNFHLR